ncbi:replication-relaxation family protein [Streptomyces sp. AJS327]|uniref:replication-relaxation family protein n=1 Tax=Streptomyces sp. AJS327 TaxID=2545265 RepID=UPI0027E491CB|nr:replication-relaxation family protein [Streptomyces sp. AJS327]
MLFEHRVLTTRHIQRLAFSSLRRAQRRLRQLHDAELVDSFRPLILRGSAPEHYTLGSAGADLLAAQAGCERKDVGWRPTHVSRIAYSPSLGHDVGVNDFVTRLAAGSSSSRPTGQATLWLSERSCARRWGDIIRPDAYVHWQDDSPAYPFPFFFEFDTGSQPLARVEAKLAGYHAFASTTATRPAVLMHTRTASREQALRHRLGNSARHLNLPIATTTADLTTNPSGPWWLPIHPPSRRLTLTELAAHWPHLSPAFGLDPTDADTPLTLPVPPQPPVAEPPDHHG